MDQQSPGPLGKGANAGSEDIGNPGDLGGGNQPPDDPKLKYAAATILAGTVILGNDEKEFVEKMESVPALKKEEEQDLVFKKGK